MHKCSALYSFKKLNAWSMFSETNIAEYLVAFSLTKETLGSSKSFNIMSISFATSSAYFFDVVTKTPADSGHVLLRSAHRVLPVLRGQFRQRRSMLRSAPREDLVLPHLLPISSRHMSTGCPGLQQHLLVLHAECHRQELLSHANLPLCKIQSPQTNALQQASQDRYSFRFATAEKQWLSSSPQPR